MKFDGTGRHVSRAMQSWSDDGDINEKFRLIRILKEVFGLYGLTGEHLTTLEGEWIKPDVFVKSSEPQIAFELDGDIHGLGDDITTTDSTWKRNERYAKLSVKLIIINEALTKYEDQEIIEVLKLHGLKEIEI